jgi:hypothetical protein
MENLSEVRTIITQYVCYPPDIFPDKIKETHENTNKKTGSGTHSKQPNVTIKLLALALRIGTSLA